MKFWARQVGCWTASREPESLQRHHVCMCEHAYMCFSLSPSPPAPRWCCHFSAYPHFQYRGFLSIGPSNQKLVLAVSVLPVCSYFLAEWRCVLHVLLFEHAQLLVLVVFFFFFFCWGTPWCQASLPVKTSWTVQNPCHLGWCYGQVTSSFQPPVLFCIEHNWNSRCFWCENYEGMDGCIAFSLLPSGFQLTVFGKPSQERSELFPGIS